jgi:hypothetical protein
MHGLSRGEHLVCGDVLVDGCGGAVPGVAHHVLTQAVEV